MEGLGCSVWGLGLGWYTFAPQRSYMRTPLSPKYMGGCQNYGLFLGTIIIGTQKGTIFLTTTRILYAENVE